MICGTTLHKTIQPYKTSSGEMFGAGVAANELISATLVADESLRWDFWTAGLQPSVSGESGSHSALPDLTHLRGQFGDRVGVRPCRALREITRDLDYIFVSNVPSLSAICELRRQLGCDQLPICALLHSALVADLLSTYTCLSLSIEEGDCLVATSRSGRVALEQILQSSREWIARSTGSATALQHPRIVEIPLGVRVPPAEALDRARARSLLHIPQNCFGVLYLGRITQMYKADLDVLLQAAARLSNSGREIRLIIAGQQDDLSYGGHIRNRLARLGLAERTILLENFPEIVKSAIFAACDVFVSPVDAIQETFGLAVLEAMAHARPVIASSWSGYRDLVLDGKTGFLLKTKWSTEAGRAVSEVAPMANLYEIAHYLAQRTLIDVGELARRLEELAANPMVATQMGERGRARAVERFSWPTVCELYFGLWQEQIQRARSGRTPRQPFTDANRFFSHYADGHLTPDNLVIKSEGTPRLGDDLADHFPFSDESQYEQIGSVLDLCEQGPMRIDSLLERGLSSDCILWTAKKGLCRIVSANEAEA